MRSSMKLACFAVLSAGSAAMAQPFAINWYTIDGGGGTSTGGAFTLSGTIGQPDASVTPMTGGAFTLTGGFWAGAGTPPVPGCTADVNNDGVVDGNDFVAFINSFSVGDVSVDPIADVNNDLIVDGNDFVEFINAFGAGC